MTRTLLLDALATMIGGLGLTLLVKPAAVRGLLRIEDSEAATYGLRIGGAMILAAALFLAGFTTAWQLAQ